MTCPKCQHEVYTKLARSHMGKPTMWWWCTFCNEEIPPVHVVH